MSAGVAGTFDATGAFSALGTTTASGTARSHSSAAAASASAGATTPIAVTTCGGRVAASPLTAPIAFANLTGSTRARKAAASCFSRATYVAQASHPSRRCAATDAPRHRLAARGFEPDRCRVKRVAVRTVAMLTLLTVLR